MRKKVLPLVLTGVTVFGSCHFALIAHAVDSGWVHNRLGGTLYGQEESEGEYFPGAFFEVKSDDVQKLKDALLAKGYVIDSYGDAKGREIGPGVPDHIVVRDITGKNLCRNEEVIREVTNTLGAPEEVVGGDYGWCHSVGSLYGGDFLIIGSTSLQDIRTALEYRGYQTRLFGDPAGREIGPGVPENVTVHDNSGANLSNDPEVINIVTEAAGHQVPYAFLRWGFEYQ